jgi:hypothetical protein
VVIMCFVRISVGFRRLPRKYLTGLSLGTGFLPPLVKKGQGTGIHFTGRTLLYTMEGRGEEGNRKWSAGGETKRSA